MKSLKCRLFHSCIFLRNLSLSAFRTFLLVIFCLNVTNVQAIETPKDDVLIRIAVASNFKAVLQELVADFQKQYDDAPITVSSGATGALYQQIRQGAPFNIFFAADELRPAELVKQGLAKKAQLYAYGRIALYSAKLTDLNRLPQTCRLGIANPKLAPYGVAAKAFIADTPSLAHCQIILGSNISQALQFAHTQNVDLGIVAYSNIVEQKIPAEQFQLLDQKYKVAQSLVLIEKPSDQMTELDRLKRERSAEFIHYLNSDSAQKIIARYGYQGSAL